MAERGLAAGSPDRKERFAAEDGAAAGRQPALEERRRPVVALLPDRNAEKREKARQKPGLSCAIENRDGIRDQNFNPAVRPNQLADPPSKSIR